MELTFSNPFDLGNVGSLSFTKAFLFTSGGFNLGVRVSDVHI